MGKQTRDGVEYDVVQLNVTTPVAYSGKLYIAPNKLATRLEVNYPPTPDTLATKLEVVLTNVKIDRPLPADTFAYTLPKDATPYKGHSIEDYNSMLLPVGSVAPSFAVAAPIGGRVELADALKGKKAVLINFWFYGCPACNEEFPHLQALYTELKDKGLELIALNRADSPEVINKYAKENNLTFLIGMSAEGTTYKATLQYRVPAYPTNYLLDSSGKIVYCTAGFDEEALRAALNKLGVK
jgi:peroxiredoxin